MLFEIKNGSDLPRVSKGKNYHLVTTRVGRRMWMDGCCIANHWARYEWDKNTTKKWTFLSTRHHPSCMVPGWLFTLAILLHCTLLMQFFVAWFIIGRPSAATFTYRALKLTWNTGPRIWNGSCQYCSESMFSTIQYFRKPIQEWLQSQ